MRFLTAGESHGPGLTTIIEGLPAGLAVDPAVISAELARRRLGFGRGPRMKLERDELEILGGVRFGLTLGGPVSVLIRNTEWDKWSEEMSPLPGESRRPATAPRPGHADLAGMQKYDTHDARDILERASARETAARTVAGTLAKSLLAAVDISVLSHVVAIGSVSGQPGTVPTLEDLPTIDESPVRAFGADRTDAMVAEIESAKADRDTLGGVVEVVVHGVMPGLGSHVHYDRRLDARLAEALMSIQAIKAVEIGDGFATAARRGSEAHDEIRYDDDFIRDTNRAGGIEGGMSMGGVIRARAAMKPLSNLMRALQTVDVETKQSEQAIRERSDVCAVPAAGVVAEQMVAIVLAQEVQRKFGGDTVLDLVAAVDHYRKRLTRF
ncbi:MAG: chorismate synthase [Acidimicrobiia bacterium]|nr:chorismate synthase [Acidimicrobiia bacterium]MBT8192218.1 chorismate synthase [Acidimicrobiia bacterium]MBT8246416.1 chorismate synthase [Acidimicrobiia bacterium]NNF88581.1 chorismate synthase [Acidimicrobiia bacterium]NNJ48375.1 chorismate synthase [Acidimicrobiia bacterium]